MRSFPWALVVLAAVMAACVLTLLSGEREVEACSTSPVEVVDAVERGVTKLMRPRLPLELETDRTSTDASAPPTSDADRLLRIVRQLAADLEPQRYSSPYWNTRLHAAALELGPAESEALAALDREGRSPTVGATIAELLRVLRARACTFGTRPSESTTREARETLSSSPGERAVPFEIAARTVAAWGDSIDHGLLLAQARAPEDEATRSTLFLALGHAPAAQVGLELAEESSPEAMIALSVFAQESAWVLGELDRIRITDSLAQRVLDAEATEPLRHRALGALLAWEAEDVGATLVHLALDPETPDSLARSAVARLARGAYAESLEQGLFTESPRRLQLAEALAARAATTTDAGLRGAVLDVLCQAARSEAAPHERRRAVHALARMPDPVALDAVARTLDEDPDPAVRAAAVVALRGFSGDDARRLLGDAAESDRSDTVRRLARHELGREHAKE